MSLQIKLVNTKAERNRFVEFPKQLYKGHPYWVPSIKSTELKLFTPEGNAVLAHADLDLWLVWRGRQVVGRVAAIFNYEEAEYRGERVARFGWIDFIDDPEVSDLLMVTVEAWARERQATRIIGPQGFTNLDKAGIITEGFDDLGTLSTWYNYPYYPQHLERLGYRKDLEWVELEIDLSMAEPPPRQVRLAERVRERYGLEVLQFKNRQEVKDMAEDVFDLLEEAYKTLPTYIPITKGQIRDYAEQYLNFLRLDQIAFVADRSGRLVSFGVVIPSLAKALQKANGKLYPLGWWYLAQAMKKNDTAELVLIGVRDDFRNKGAYIPVFQHIFYAFKKMGIKRLRANPMLEQNANVLGLFEIYNAVETRRRRTYQKEL